MNPRDFGQATVRPRRPNPLVVLWRWRYEAAAAGLLALTLHALGPLWTVLFGLALAAVVLGVPPVRRYARCVLTAHRVRTACLHLWLQSRTGRLPLVLWTRPVRGGELCVLWCRPGLAAADIAEVREQFAAACWATDVEVAVDKRRSQLVYLTVRRAGQDAAAYTPSPT